MSTARNIFNSMVEWAEKGYSPDMEVSMHELEDIKKIAEKAGYYSKMGRVEIPVKNREGEFAVVRVRKY